MRQTACGYALLLACFVHEASAFTFPAPLALGFADRVVAIRGSPASLAPARQLRRSATLSLSMMRPAPTALPIKVLRVGMGGGILWTLKGLLSNEVWVLTSLIICMGVMYEKGSHAMKHAVPKTYLPVVQAMLNELGGLGFISTAVFVLTHPGGQLFSLMFNMVAGTLGESPSHLIHNFELLHFAIFFIVNVYFAQAFFVVFNVIRNQRELKSYVLPEEAADVEGGAFCVASNSVLSKAMSWSSRWPKQPLAILWRELTLNTADRRAEYFRFRQRVVDRGPELHLEKSSIVECFPGYVEQCIGHSMEHLVEITARTWGLVWFGISMFVFLTNVCTPYLGSEMAKVAVFLTCNSMVVLALLVVFTKLARVTLAIRPSLNNQSIKYSTVQTTAAGVYTGGTKRVIAPPPYLTEGYMPNRWWYAPVRKLFGIRPPRNDHEQVFGLLGASGPSFYATGTQAIWFVSTLLLAANVSMIQKILRDLLVPGYLRLLSFLPSLLILWMMPEIVLRLSYATSTERFLNLPLLRETVHTHNRDLFIKGLTGIFTSFLLSRNGEHCIQNKLATLRKRVFAGESISAGRLDENEEAKIIFKLPAPSTALLQQAYLHVATNSVSGREGNVLEKSKIARVLHDLGTRFSEEEVDLLFAYMDSAGKGTVDMQSFVATLLLPFPGMAPLTAADMQEDVIASCVDRLFEKLDTDGDGQICLAEMQRGMKELFPLWSPSSLVPFFREMNTKNNGRVDREELMFFFRKSLD